MKLSALLVGFGLVLTGYGAEAMPRGMAVGPETWLEIMGGNLSVEGLRKDLAEIKRAGLSGVHFFHIDRGGAWPDCPEQITCLSEKWDSVVAVLGEECRRLGLKLTVQNCPGWSQSGGPWIAVTNAMRDLECAMSVAAGGRPAALPAIPERFRDADSDWRDIAVLAFPKPLDDDWRELKPIKVETNGYHRIYTFEQPVTLRTAVWEHGVYGFNPAFAYHAPWMHVRLEALGDDGSAQVAFDNDLPVSDWRDYVYSFSLACNEFTARRWLFTFTHHYPIKQFKEPKFFAAARTTDWEGKSARVLRSQLFLKPPRQNPRTWVKRGEILDLTDKVGAAGTLDFQPQKGEWIILRVGHVNAKRVNAPAPKEATGWECDKLDPQGIEANFRGYVERLMNGPLAGALSGVVVDSWECFGQTWTPKMSEYFQAANGYDVRKFLPALFGWVLDDPEATDRFLLDWRRTIGELITKNYYGRMTEIAHAHGLTVAYETAFGDIAVGDLLEYWKYADEPMCEFWLPHATKDEGFVGSLAHKPVRPCVSAAHIYGNRRVTAEAFTGWGISWKEDFAELRDVANRHFAKGITHLALQSYTHSPNPQAMPPGACMGGWNGTPFTHLQTWWREMPVFTAWLRRCEARLEAGTSVNDVLWYLGDAVDHRPDDYFAFPEGFAPDYLNHDVLMTRLAVKEGKLTIPEGTEWKILWVPETHFLRTDSRRRLEALAAAGAKIVYGDKSQLVEALKTCQRDVSVSPAMGDELSEDFMWCHRREGRIERYFVAAGTNGFARVVKFRAQGPASIYDPVTDRRWAWKNGTELRLAPSESVFVEFGVPAAAAPQWVPLKSIDGPWQLGFTPGWDAPTTLTLASLGSWTEIPGLSAAARAYSGKVVYETAFELSAAEAASRTVRLDLGQVKSVAKVWVNDREVGTWWCLPFAGEITRQLRAGRNTLRIEVANTWHNRLVYDLNLPLGERKTWTIYNPGYGPSLNSPLIPAGLLGPVRLYRAK